MAGLVALSPDGFVHRSTGLDFHYLRLWVGIGAGLLLMGVFAGMLARIMESRTLQRPSESEEVDGSGTEAEATTPAPAPTPVYDVIYGLLVGSGWLVLVVALIAAVPQLPGTVAARLGVSEPESVVRYLQVFNSLAVWTAIISGFFVVVRGAREVWPEVGRALPFPGGGLITLAIAYLFLSGDGVLSLALEFPGGVPLALITLALALPYLASVLRRVVTIPMPRRVLVPLQGLLLVADCGWVALVLGVMVMLPRVAADISSLQPGGTFGFVAPYLDILDSMALWSIILLSPFVVIRAVAAFRPAIGEVFGFPVGRVILFALALVSFSDKGIPATASAFPIPNLMPITAVALAVSYISLMLRRTASLGLPDRIARPMAEIPPLVSALVRGLTLSMIAWAALDSLPLLAAPLLDRGGASAAGETTFPYLASFYNVRLTAAGFVFAAILTWSLPNPLWSQSRWHVRPLVMALGSAASGCLLWAAGVQLSDLGHGFPLACAVAGVGLLTLGLSELAEYATDSREFLVSGLAGWLRGSRMRGFMLGASFAFYGMFLRPLMYETLWFAGVYEWLAVLVLAFWAMTQARSLLRPHVESAEAAPVSWSGWNRHEQSFENRPDPRLNLLERWQRQFVESGEWADMWTYLTGLLCRNGASPTATGEVIRPIRDSVGPGAKLPLWRGGQKREEQNRRLALAHSLESIEGAMANRSAQQLNTREPALPDLAGPYVATGQDPETVAAAVISAYHRRGADLDLAISLWFPMVDHVERPPRWFEPPWVRNRNRRRALGRRRRLVEAAVAHLAGEASLADLPVAVAASRTPTFFMLPSQDREILPLR